MFDILAIDWGQKRYGLSYGDSSTKLVIPDKNHRFTKNIYSDLELIFNSKPINTIVIGLPTNFQLQSTKITQVIEDFILVIKQKFSDKKIITINERGTTQESINLGAKDSHTINHLSATYILKRFLGLY